MTTPEGSPPGNPDEGADRAAWGRPPAGGWGEPARDAAAPPAAAAPADVAAGEQTRSWSESAPDVDGPTRVDQPRPEQLGPEQARPQQGRQDQGRQDQSRQDQDATRLEQPGVWGAPSAGPQPGGLQQPGLQQPGLQQPGLQQPGLQQPGLQPGGPQQGGQQPAWAQQPPPAGGWNVPPQQQGGPSGWGPPPQGQYPTQGQYPPYPGQQQPYPGQQYPGGPQQGYGAPQWGQGYPPLPDAARPPRRSRVPLVVGALVMALLVLGAVLAFVSPGFLNTTVFDQAALQSGVQRVLVEDYGYGVVGDVACGAPGEAIRVSDGATFSCTATIDGAPATVPVRVTSGSGDYEVGRPA